MLTIHPSHSCRSCCSKIHVNHRRAHKVFTYVSNYKQSQSYLKTSTEYRDSSGSRTTAFTGLSYSRIKNDIALECNFARPIIALRIVDQSNYGDGKKFSILVHCVGLPTFICSKRNNKTFHFLTHFLTPLIISGTVA